MKTKSILNKAISVIAILLGGINLGNAIQYHSILTGVAGITTALIGGIHWAWTIENIDNN